MQRISMIRRVTARRTQVTGAAGQDETLARSGSVYEAGADRAVVTKFIEVARLNINRNIE